MIVPNFTYRLNNINWIEEIYRPCGGSREERVGSWRENENERIRVEERGKKTKIEENTVKCKKR